MRKLNQTHLKVPGSLISLCFAMAVFPLYSSIMAWVWILFACALGVAWSKMLKKAKALKNTTVNLLAVFCMLLLVVFSGQFGLLATMINLLVVAGCLKLITMRSFADFHLIIVVVIFLIACGFIYHQNLLFTVFYASVLFGTLSAVYMLNKGGLSTSSGLKQSSKLMIQAIPITILLFLMVPRLPPFWQAPSNQSSSTGLSEKLSPGDIADLAQSGDLAFRAEFTDAIPAPHERYWRALVLDSFDGASWSMSEETSNTENTAYIEPSGEAIRYLVIAEPNELRWQYSLDFPIVEEVISDRTIYRNQSYQLYTQKENNKRSLYIVNSYPDMPLNHFMTEYERRRNLQLPKVGNQKTQNFVAQNITASMTEREKLKTMLRLYSQNNFAYTLRPPLMQNNPIDQFLFEFQRGFCSHYAASLAYMLRLANVPARIVTGYQGGELQNGNILTVRQYDAHAWVEYWIENEGWTRIDPTAIVAPDRLMSGLLSSLNEEEGSMVERPFNLSRFENVPLLSQLQDFLVLIDHQWTQSVLRFDQDSQRDLIKQWFGEFNAKNMTTFMFMILGTIVLFIGIVFLPYKSWFMRKSYSHTAKFLSLMSRHGYHKQAQETLKQFVARISPDLNDQQTKQIGVFVNRYYRAEYAQTSTSTSEFDHLLYLIKSSMKKA